MDIFPPHTLEVFLITKVFERNARHQNLRHWGKLNLNFEVNLCFGGALLSVCVHGRTSPVHILILLILQPYKGPLNLHANFFSFFSIPRISNRVGKHPFYSEVNVQISTKGHPI